MSTTFTFEMKNPEDGGTYDWLRLTPEAFAHDADNMKDKDDILIDKDKIKVSFNYPLKKEFIFELVPSGGKLNFTRIGLATAIANKYQEIYQEERDTSVLPEETCKERSERLGGKKCYMINRAQTDGKYGIWGHALEDIVINWVTYYEDKNMCDLALSS